MASFSRTLPAGAQPRQWLACAQYIAFPCIALFAPGVIAQPVASGSAVAAHARIDPVVVTAARSPQPLAELIADVTVIGPAEIARSGAQSLPELLQRQPGIEIVQNGGPGATSGVFLRGANRGQTLVLIDGVRLASATVGATSLEAIPLDLIERIEVLRGPASSLYGADAIGGVIQVFTRRGSGGFGANASAGYGTYDTRSATGGVSGTLGPLNLALQGGGTQSRGFNAIVDPLNFSYNPDPDGYARENVSGNVALAWSPGQSLSAQVFRSRLNNQFDAGSDHDDCTITTLTSWQAGSSNQIAAWWSSMLTVATSGDSSVSKTGFGDFPFTTVQRQYTWQNLFTLPVGALTLGVERREEDVSGADFAVTARDTDSVFAVYQLRDGPHALQVNLRRDESTQYGGQTTGSIAYGYRLSPQWRLTVSGGTAFKAPSFNDLYYPDFSNPDLEPETSRNVEGGIHWTGAAGEAQWQARAIAWYNRVEQLIVFGCSADFVCRPDNVDRATLKGVSLGADLVWRDTTLKGSLDLQSPEDDLNGKLLPRRARSHGALSLLQRAGPTTLGVELVASGRRYDDPANRVPLAGYAIVNLTAEWPLRNNVTVFVRGDNVLDRDYQLASGYGTGGAQFFVGLRWLP
jgi:vitamin B12 transporter